MILNILDMNNKNEIIKYINLLIERDASKFRKTGVTLWVLMAALFFLFLKILNIGLLKSNNSLFYLNTLFVFINIYWVFSSFKMLSKVNPPLMDKYDLKIYSGDDGFSDILSEVPSIFILSSLLLIFIYISYSFININPYQKYILILQSIVPTIFIAVSLIFIPFFILLKKYNTDLYIALISKKFSRYSVIDSLDSVRIGWKLRFLFLLLLLGSGYSLWVHLSSQIISSANDIITLAIYLTAVALILEKIIHNLSHLNPSYISSLKELERELICDETNEKEALWHLKEIIGCKIEEWLDNKRENIADSAKLLRKHIDKTSKFKIKIKSIDPEFDHEINKRIDDFIDTSSELYKSFLDEFYRMKIILTQYKKDKDLNVYERQLVEKTIYTLDTVKYKLEKKFRKHLENLKNI